MGELVTRDQPTTRLHLPSRTLLTETPETDRPELQTTRKRDEMIETTEVQIRITPDFQAFTEALNAISKTIRQTSLAMRRLSKATRNAGRRIERNIIRANRRPALIHKGGKPRV